MEVVANNLLRNRQMLISKVKDLNEWIDILMLPDGFSLENDPIERATNNGWNDALRLIKRELTEIIDSYEQAKTYKVTLTDNTSIICDDLRFVNIEKDVVVTNINDMDTNAITEQVDKGFKSLVVDNIWELFTEGKSNGSIVSLKVEDIANALMQALNEVEWKGMENINEESNDITTNEK